MTRLILFFFFLFCFNTYSKDQLHIGVFQVKPYGFYENGKVVGLSRTLLDEIFGDEFEIKYSLYPYNRTIEYLANDRIDLTIMFKNKHVQKCCIEVDQTLAAKNILVSYKSSKIKSFSDLQRRSVAFIRGANYGKSFEAYSLKKFQATNYEQSVKLLVKKRVDAIVISARAWVFFEKELNLERNEFNKLLVNYKKSSLFVRPNLPERIQKKLIRLNQKFLKQKPKLMIDDL